MPADSFLDWVSLNQSYHPAPLYPVKGVHDVVPVEYGQEMFHRSGSVARPGINIFPQDAPGILNSTNDRVLVGTIHDTAQRARNLHSRLKTKTCIQD